MARVLHAGDASLTIEFGSTADPAFSAQVLGLFDRVTAEPPAGLVEAVPTLRSLTLHFDPLLSSAPEIETSVRAMVAGLTKSTRLGSAWRLPVCYDRDLGLDLAEVAATLKLTEDAVVALHAGTAYRVLMLGFLPGFPYMGETAPPLRLPRRATPRASLPAGSVAIATTMTVIYTSQSPGGWHVLGRTPVRLFDALADAPVLLSPGDEVRFVPVTREEFDRLDQASRDGSWRPVPEPAGAA